MARADYETSRVAGQPVALYRVQYGDSAAYTYTNADQPITYDAEVYEPHAITHSKLDVKGKLERRDMTLTVSLASPVAALFRVFPPGRVVQITVREGHVPNASDPVEWASGENFPVAFQGRILESRRQGNEAKLTCEYASASLKRVGLRRHYQWACPLALYGDRCGADKAAATGTGTVAAGGLSANRVTLSPGWGNGSPRQYVGGMIEWTGPLGAEARTIYNVDGDTLILDSSIQASDLPDGTSVSVVLGCPHTFEGCTSVHNNAVNFGGHPWVPTDRNPLGKNNHSGG